MRPFIAALLLGLFAASSQAETTLHFAIDLTAEIAAGRFDPARDRLGLRGGAAPLSWDRSLLAEPGGKPGRYRLQLTLPDDATGGQPLAYKFRIERGAGQDGSEGWEPGRNHALLLNGGQVMVARLFGAPAGDVPVSRVGRIERLGVVASTHVSPREVQVWLPPGYAEHAQARYPVLYLHDGQNVFDAQAAGSEWQVDEAAQRGVASGRLKPFIVVAVSSNEATRMDDYTPTVMTLSAERLGKQAAERRGGGAAAYARFLVEELKPVIDARYRTQPGPADTAVGGSSLGGLVSMWLALHRPEAFGAALVVSPSVWWDDRFLLRDVAATTAAPRPRLWLDMGVQEGDQAVQLARELNDSLRRRGWSDGALRFVEDPSGRHDEGSWARRVPAMLDFLYRADAQ
ncbi:putative alpha/beta superfamily hydrolase [Pelomonas saccharophila]|uniref:Alpha/beta superfamily hydrolase n=1 Tax=Roseateles saccharophilus TaxID=304 RepID=A0ABU1YSC4_ROSSA|nr:alpha/beta hydrolase-fold protein [Roseateles saccharophilus]MDR7271747.1 putative alpha/beta superfamily hydrolase [Roseateles saccharophilus]